MRWTHIITLDEERLGAVEDQPTELAAQLGRAVLEACFTPREESAAKLRGAVTHIAEQGQDDLAVFAWVDGRLTCISELGRERREQVTKYIDALGRSDAD